MNSWAALCLAVYSGVGALSVALGHAGGRKRRSR